jgi:hypothetical protein
MHAYDSPGLSAHEFLLAVMRDQSLDLHYRMFAAQGLCHAGLGHIPTVRTIMINIEGGITDSPLGTDTHGVVSDAGCAADHRPPRRHRGFYLVKKSG